MRLQVIMLEQPTAHLHHMPECPAQDLCLIDCMQAQVYKGVLNKTRAVAVKTFAHMASEAEVIRFNAVSLCEAFPLPNQYQLEEAPGTHNEITRPAFPQHEPCLCCRGASHGRVSRSVRTHLCAGGSNHADAVRDSRAGDMLPVQPKAQAPP